MRLSTEETAQSPPWIRGEIDLLIAMIRQAIFDLNDREERPRAIEWLTQAADESDEFTVPWICSLTGNDYRRVRRLIDNKIKESAYVLNSKLSILNAPAQGAD